MGITFCLCCSGSPCQEQNKIPPDIMLSLEEVQSMEKVEELITYIDILLSNTGTGRQEPIISRPTPVDSGRHLMENFSKSLNRHVCKKRFLSALDRQTRNMVTEVINQAQPIPCIGIALSIIAYLLERAEEVSSNKDQCLELLRSMSALAKHMKNLDTHLARDKLNDFVSIIVKGTLMCALLMQRNRVCRFMFSAVDTADIENLKSQISLLFPDLILEAETEVLNRIPIYPDPSQGEYPRDAVGMEEAKKEVTKLLDLRQSSRRVVVIYGVGGIGKTTLASAVFSGLDLTNYHYCRVNMDQDINDLKAIQQQILRNLFAKNLTLDDCEQGREKLSEAFENASKPVFLFIDNALRQTDLEKLLPFQHISGLPLHSRILITTRNLKETYIFSGEGGIEIYSHRVDSVSEPEAKRVLCHYALGDQHRSFDTGVNMEDLLQVCAGIPLVLRIVGSDMRTAGNTMTACNDIIEYHREWKQKGFEGGEEDFSERIVDFVYGRLKETSKEAFLDIAFFFYDWERSKVADIVGEMHLGDLEAAALVTTSEEGDVKVHDIVRARGRRLSNGNRIIDRESFSVVLSDDQKLQQTKGIRLGYDCKLSLEAKHVDLMSPSLRVLSLGWQIRLNGRCDKAFQELRFLDISHEHLLAVDLSRASRLVFFKSCLIKRHRNSEEKSTINLPDSLRLLSLEAPRHSPVSVDIIGHLTLVREIDLSGITFENFEDNIRIGNFSCLKKLKINRYSTTLPESFGNISSLQNLYMRNFSILKSLPDSFGNLSCLQTLHIIRCSLLEAKAMDSLVEIRSLMFLDIDESPMLIKRWEEIQQHPPLIGLPVRLTRYYKSYEERLSSMLFSGGSRFVQVDGDGRMAEVASSSFPDVGVKVCLFFTACSLSEEVKQKLLEVASQEFQIMYVDVEMEGEGMEEREKRIRETLLQLPEGSWAWTSPFYKSRVLFAYWLWKFTGCVDTSMVVTSVVVDEEGRRKLSSPLEKILGIDDCESRRVELTTLFSPVLNAYSWMTNSLEKRIMDEILEDQLDIIELDILNELRRLEYPGFDVVSASRGQNSRVDQFFI